MNTSVKPLLYFAAGTRSSRPCWLLEECGVSYDLEKVALRKGEHKRGAYLAMNPLGKVPALKEGDNVITETLGICLHIADRHGANRLAPEIDDPNRAAYYRWMAFSVGSLEASLLEEVRRQGAEETGSDFMPMSRQLSSFESVATLIEGTLSTSGYLLGSEFSAADVLNGSGMFWARGLGLLEGFEHIQRWLDKLEARPAYNRMLEISQG
ncbi:glutathione S-transferase family protein [Kiloniella sp.]|uniref:glutathione S-transferase family protein n=1 Tax=Kiloniella sp. TaxID=1938587 RepID=UPI003B021901